MSKKFLSSGDTLSLIAPYDRLSGEGALIGSLFGVAVNDVLSGASGVFAIEGEFTLKKVGSQAWALGEPIYWDASLKQCTTDDNSNANYFIGHATAVAGSGAGVVTGNVRLHGCPFIIPA